MNSARTRRFTAAALAGTTLAVALASSAMAQPVKPETLMAERSNPAVQLVETTVGATVSMRNIDLTRAGSDLFTVGVAKWYAGELRSASDVVEYAFERVERDPSHYLKQTGARRTAHFSESFRGTGFIATPDGYVVTARHVVTSDKEVKQSFAERGATAFAKADVKALLKDFAQYDLSNAAVNHIVSAVSTFEAQKVKVTMTAPKVSVILGTASGDGSRIGKAYPAEVAYRSKATLGEDVAVLRIHVDGQLPSLALASATPTQGDTIYINGFPALPDGSRAALLQPTLTKGQVTAVKPTGSGIQQLQTDATASPGSSGGPAFNEAGEVIGILVSGARDRNGGSLGQNYLMPLDSVRTALGRTGAAPAAGQTTSIYNAALDDFYADHYTKALDEFRQVKELFPAHAYAGGYISRSQLAISQGLDVPVVPPASPLPWMLIVLAGGAALVFLGGGTVLVLVLRRRPAGHAPAQPAQLAAGAGFAAPSPQGGPYPAPAYAGMQNPAPAYAGMQNPAPAYVGMQNPTPGYAGMQNPAPAYAGMQNPTPGYAGGQNPNPGYVGGQQSGPTGSQLIA